MLSVPFPMGQFPGQLPVNAELTVKNVMFLVTATAKKVVKFDMALTTATSFDPYAGTSGAGTSAWAMVTNVTDDTATINSAACDVYCVADSAVGTANTRGDVTVMGAVAGMTMTGSTSAKGDHFTASMGTKGQLAPLANTPTTLVAGARNRKICAIGTAAGSANTVAVHFNGFGWGVTFKNVAVTAD